MSRVIVVGGGPSGLAAAQRLTRSGLTVQLLEASGRTGGKTTAPFHLEYLSDLAAPATEIGRVDDLVPGRFVLCSWYKY